MVVSVWYMVDAVMLKPYQKKKVDGPFVKRWGPRCFQFVFDGEWFASCVFALF